MTATTQRTNLRPLPEHLEQIFQEHHRLVYRAAYRITGRAEDAEDILQTLFLKLLRQPPGHFQGNLKGYLHRAAINMALDVIKLRKPTVLADASAASDNRLNQFTDAQQLVQAALAELSPKVAEMFVLKHLEGYSNREIANLVGTSSSAVAVMLFRARARLKKSIKAQMGASYEKRQ